MTASAPDKNILLPMLGELITFISEVAIAIRMNSSYNRVPENPEIMPDNVMWLSDALHNFRRLGQAISTRDLESISEAASMQATSWNTGQKNIAIAGEHNFDIGIGITLLNSISVTALRLADTE